MYFGNDFQYFDLLYWNDLIVIELVDDESTLNIMANFVIPHLYDSAIWMLKSWSSIVKILNVEIWSSIVKFLNVEIMKLE